MTTNALKVSRTFKTNRSLNNKWTTFGSPIRLTASAEYGSGLILYAATGYTASRGPLPKVGKGLFTGKGSISPPVAYLLAAERGELEPLAKQPPMRRSRLPAYHGSGRFRRCPRERRVPLPDKPRLANLTLRGIYVLNAEGTRFDLQEADYVLKPFEAYIANNVTRSLGSVAWVYAISVVTANEIATATAAVRIWAADGALRIYSGRPPRLPWYAPTDVPSTPPLSPPAIPLGFYLRYLHG